MKRNAIFLAVSSLFAQAAFAQAVLPTGGTLTRGSGSISTSGSTMTMTQTSQRAIWDFTTHDVGAGATVNYAQPDATAIAVARVGPGGGRSLIDGAVSANGHLMLLNPNGVLFGATAVVNVGSLTVSSGNINDNAFMASNTAPVAITGATSGSIENRGSISVAAAGLAAFVAPSVVNSGNITALGGRIVLAGAQAATLSLNGGLYEIALDQGVGGSNVSNSGTLSTAALSGPVTGTIVVSALDAANAVSGVINLQGVQRANRIEVHGGEVHLKSDLDATTVAGTSSVVHVEKAAVGGGQVQDGVDIAKSGGTVNVGEGSFAGSVTIGKALTLDGAGKGKTIINPGSNATGILVTGNIGAGATVTISDLTVQGGGIGIKVADLTTLGTITLDRLAVLDNSSQGFISNNGGSNPTSVANINILDSVFAGNGVGPGSADINLFRFNGNATIKNVDILGTRGSASNLAAATDYGLQIRGQGEVGHTSAAGVVKLENVRIAGNYRRAHLGIQRYSDASSITMSGVQLGGKLENVTVGASTPLSVLTSNAGFGKFFSSDEGGSLSLGNTLFAKDGSEPATLLDIAIGEGTAGLRVDAIGATFEGLTRSLADNFKIEKRVGHAVDATNIEGVVTWQDGNLFVTSDRSIQRGINVASVGDTVNVQGGTSTSAPAVYAENLLLSKALTLKGEGAGRTIIDPVSGDAVSISGNMGADATLTIDGFRLRDAPRYGVKVAQDTVLKELKILNSEFLSNGQNGFALLGSPTDGVPGLTKVTLQGDTFIGNGMAPASSLGYGDILFDYYNGNVALKNLQILGVGEFIGIQMRGASPIAGHPLPAGIVEFDDVRINGSFLRPNVPNGNPTWHNVGTWNPGGPGDAIHLLEYSSVANVSFNNVTISLDSGHGMFLEGLGSTLNIGNTTFGLNRVLDPLGIGTTITDREKVSRNIFIGGNDNGLVTNVDASHASFTTASSAAATNFAIEDRVYHALDTSGLGLVTWNPGHLYVTLDSGSIQRGIDAACACDTVHVDAGTFAEQLRVNKSLILVGAGDQTIISPTSLTADASGMKSILTIGGGATTEVEVSGFTFKGPVPELNAGIFVRDGAYAHIHDNKLVDMRESAALSGNQRGIGIFVGRNSLGTSGTALIENNYLSGYQKGGIVVDGPASLATITGNTVIGEGPTDRIAQNGIQVSRGASAHIEGNTVRGNNYTPSSDDATGILIFTPGVNLAQGEITVGPNNVSDNEVGIWTNDPRSLTRTSLSGVSGNGRQAVADFGGGYAGQANLEYPAWSASNAAMVSPGAFGGRESGDIVDLGGALRVTGWSGFAAIQPAVNAVANGASIDVAAGTYAESVVLNALRNLTFNNVTLQGLTINAGGAGSGLRGSVMANGSTGFVFNAPVYLLGDTTLATTGANIVLNGDIQGFGGGAYALSLNAGTGDVTMVSGGSASNPLGRLEVDSNNFTLFSTLWVSGYDINALGTVALSDHTLRSVGGGAPDAISAGGDVTGSTTSVNAVQIDAGGDVAANVTALGAVLVEATNVSGTYSGPALTFHVLETINATVDATGPVEVASRDGSIRGNFGDLVNSGSGLLEVNGRQQLNTRLADSVVNYDRVIPVDITTAASPDAGSKPQQGKVRRRKAEDAAEVLENGESLELDLSPGN